MKRTPLHARILPSYTRGEELMNMITHIVGGALGLGAYIAAFFALLSLFRVVGKEDIAWLKGLVQRK